MKKLLVAALLATVSISPAFAADKTVSFKNIEGNDVGTADLTQTSHGLLICLDLWGIPAGDHAFHIHETGLCDDKAKFKSAGPHYNPEKNEHGYHTASGPHDGDMPNVNVPESGKVETEIFNEEAELSELLEGDGAALIIHETADDYTSQPSGNAGGRLACAVVK